MVLVVAGWKHHSSLILMIIDCHLVVIDVLPLQADFKFLDLKFAISLRLPTRQYLWKQGSSINLTRSQPALDPVDRPTKIGICTLALVLFQGDFPNNPHIGRILESQLVDQVIGRVHLIPSPVRKSFWLHYCCCGILDIFGAILILLISHRNIL